MLCLIWLFLTSGGGVFFKAIILWYNVLKMRYVDLSSNVFCVGKYFKVPSSCSFWWKDILKISSSSLCDHIVENSRFIIHNGFNTPFWESTWLEDIFLKELFLNLFKSSYLKKVSVEEKGRWFEGVWQ